jgi:hypothetical protein
MHALAELLGASGIETPEDLKASFVHLRGSRGTTTDLTGRVDRLAPGELLAGAGDQEFADAWRLAQTSSFEPLRA